MQDYDFRTPLHYAARHGHAEIVRFLILRGSNINALDRWNQTPFYEAVTNLHPKVVKILSQHSGGFSLQGLHLACFLNKIIMAHNLEMLQLATLAADFTLRCADYDERTPLHVAGHLGYGHIYHYLVSKGADTKKPDIWGNLPVLKSKNITSS